MKPIRPLNVGGVGLLKGKIRNSLASLTEAADKVEKLLDENTFRNKSFSAISVIIYYADITEIFPPKFPSFKRIRKGYLYVEIGLEMKRLQTFANESRLTDVFIWALLETLKSISQKYDLPIEGLDDELAKYKKIKENFCSENS